jgi:hypothetical protein
MYSIGDFAALISEEQKLEKTNYEKRIAYVGCGRTSGGGDLRANHFYRTWDSGGTPCRGHSVTALLFESGT